MKKIIFTFLLFASVGIFAQQASSKKPFVLVDGMVASEAYIKKNERNIKSMHVYKTAATLPANLKNMDKYAANGIIEVKVKEQNFDRISFASLNEQFQLAKTNPVYFDGNLITDTELVVLGDILANMKAENVDGQKHLVIHSTY